MQDDLDLIRALSGGVNVDTDVFMLMMCLLGFSPRSFIKYVTRAKVAFPRWPKYLFSLPEVWNKHLTNVSTPFWKSPTQQPVGCGCSGAALLLPSLDYWSELGEG